MNFYLENDDWKLLLINKNKMITNALDHLISYDDLLVNAIETRRWLNVEDTCKYWIEILDQYLWW